MNLGTFSLSLKVKDLQVSQEFYEKLGFNVLGGDKNKNWLIMKNGNCIIGLFQGMFEKNILTFNPCRDENGNIVEPVNDVREIQKQLEERGIEIIDEADETTEGPDFITLEDPDGNPILIDQHT